MSPFYQPFNVSDMFFSAAYLLRFLRYLLRYFVRYFWILKYLTKYCTKYRRNMVTIFLLHWLSPRDQFFSRLSMIKVVALVKSYIQKIFLLNLTQWLESYGCVKTAISYDIPVFGCSQLMMSIIIKVKQSIFWKLFSRSVDCTSVNVWNAFDPAECTVKEILYTIFLQYFQK